MRAAAHICRIAALGLLALASGLSQAQPAAAASAPVAASAAEYRLGAGDVIRISVYQNPDLSLETRVSEAGVISFPLLGNQRVGGISVTQAEKLLAEGLKNGNFVKNPQVTIVVLQVKATRPACWAMSTARGASRSKWPICA